ncbi:MAG: subtilisin family serine protease [Myxococcota bacterium]|jgi:subtilisin family serine protease
MLLLTTASSLIFALASQQSLQGQLPKNDLGVTQFLKEHPEYNGRGIRVAVLDTGIDPGHPFLQTTPDGRRKIVEWYDATTDALLPTDYVAKQSGGYIVGLSGRRLDLGQYAKYKEFHLGRIGAEFFPGALSARIAGDRHADWAEAQLRYTEAQVGAEDVDATLESVVSARNSKELLNDGPVYDVIVYSTNDGWRVVIDSDEDGNLGEEQSLAPFNASGDWATLGDESNLNYAVNVSDDGNMTSIYFDAHGHGTHVAGIIGSYEGEGARLNGIAPGVEFVAIKIGDSKVGGSTSGFAVSKALDYAVEAGCQIANMSFGGPSFYADGREPDDWIVEEAAKRGLLLVTSAGNEGPTLSTVGSPGTSESAWSIAAAIWPDTQKVSYSSLNPAAPLLFDFSSRGPLPTGDLGIDFAAPGAALSALPSWTLAKGESWNGTSMAAPQMAGCVALLESAAMGENLPTDHETLHRAFRLSATRFPQHDWVEVGHGFIDMLPALSHLRMLANERPSQTLFDIRTVNQFGVGEGIYVRGLLNKDSFSQSVSIKPHFDNDSTNAAKSDFLRSYVIESEAAWVVAPEGMYTSANGNSITLNINPQDLAPGLHSTRVLMYDADKPRSIGAEIIIPVTVVVQLDSDSAHKSVDHATLQQGGLHRSFVMVPHGANYVDVKVAQHGGGRNEYRPGAGSVSALRYYEDRQQRGRFFLEDGDIYTTRVKVEEGTLFEYALSARWTTNTSADLDVEFSFVGLHAAETTFEVPVGQETAYFGYTSPLHNVSGLRASASVNGIAKSIDAEMKIIVDPIRSHVMTDHGMFQGVIEFDQTIAEDVSSVSLFTPHSIQTTEWREDLMLEVFDSNDAVVVRQIMYEVETEIGHLDAGDYHFRVSFPSLGQNALEAHFAGLVLHLYQSKGSFTLYPSLQAVFDQSGPSSSLSIPAGGGRTLFASLPALDALPAGCWYFGEVSVADGEGTVASNPIKVYRGVAADEVVGADDAEVEAEVEVEAEALGDIEQAWVDVQADKEATDADKLTALLEWADSEASRADVQFTKFEFYHANGLHQQLHLESAAFLKSFPSQRQAFMDAAKTWK